MSGTNRNSLESDINASTQDKGYRQDLMLSPLGAWRDKDGLNLTGATTPALVVMGGSASPAPKVVKWAANAATTVLATYDGAIPGELAFPPVAPGASFNSALKYDVHLFVPCRKVEATDADVATPASFDLIFKFGTPGTQGIALTAINKVIQLWTVAGVDNTTDATGAVGFSTLDFDIGAEIRAEITAGTITAAAPVLKPRDWFEITLGLHAQNATPYIEMLTPYLCFRRHAALRYSGTNATFKSVRGG